MFLRELFAPFSRFFRQLFAPFCIFLSFATISSTIAFPYYSKPAGGKIPAVSLKMHSFFGLAAGFPDLFTEIFVMQKFVNLCHNHFFGFF